MRGAERIQQLLKGRAKSHGATLTVDGASITVAFASGRTQRVSINEDDTHVLLESAAVRRVEQTIRSAELDELILRTNHAAEIVGLRRKNGTLTAFVKLLKDPLDRGEVIHGLLAVAREADRLEEMVTGKDIE